MKPYSYILLTSQISHQNLSSPSTLNNGRCIKISATGVNQKPNYNCSKFSEPFTKRSVKGSEHVISHLLLNAKHSNFDKVV